MANQERCRSKIFVLYALDQTSRPDLMVMSFLRSKLFPARPPIVHVLISPHVNNLVQRTDFREWASVDTTEYVLLNLEAALLHIDSGISAPICLSM